jgi:ABC-type branched-subunit amino acid transport system substrate-binding protein
MRGLALLGLALLLSGCGSTVQGTSASTTAAGNGLTSGQAPAAQLGGPTTTGGTQLPGGSSSSTGGTPGTPGASGSQGQTGGTQPGPQAGPQTNQPAGAANTAPIELGFMSTNTGNAQQLGLNAGQTYSDKQAYEALVKEYNQHGGLSGRKIVPVYGDTDTASSDWNGQFQAACAHLTEDNHVQAVLGYVFVFLDSFERCLAQHQVPHLYGGYQPGDQQAQQDFPTIVSVAHPTVDGSNETVLSGAMAAGVLTTKSKLGILYDACAHGDRAFTKSTEPWLKAHRLNYETVAMPCSSGSSDVSAGASAVQGAELQFAAHGVNVVFVPNAIGLLVFMNNAESQGYHPTYINQGFGAAFEAQGGAVPQAQLKNLHGFGWMPAIDANQQHQPYATTPQQAACLSKLKHQGLIPKQYNDFMFAYVTCDSLDLYAKALALTGGRSGLAEVRSALLRVMPSFTGAATYGGAYAVSERQRGGPGSYRETAWTDSCSCFTYRGTVRRVPAAS